MLAGGEIFAFRFAQSVQALDTREMFVANEDAGAARLRRRRRHRGRVLDVRRRRPHSARRRARSVNRGGFHAGGVHGQAVEIGSDVIRNGADIAYRSLVRSARRLVTSSPPRLRARNCASTDRVRRLVRVRGRESGGFRSRTLAFGMEGGFHSTWHRATAGIAVGEREPARDDDDSTASPR